MSLEIAQAALRLWGLDGAALHLIAQRENLVFQVDSTQGRFALRLHRPGYQSAARIRSELQWMQMLRTAGLTVPEPIAAQDGTVLQDCGTFQVDLLSWQSGQPMGATGRPLTLSDRPGTFHRLGAVMAEMHAISDRWDRPADFTRPHWNADGLLGPDPLWGRFWNNPGLSNDQRKRLIRARDQLRADISSSAQDYGLIHADMLRENVMLDGGNIGLIDFDDSGFGHRLFDVVTALFKNRSEPDYPALEVAFLDGYRTVRGLDTSALPQFMLVRALSYLGWIIPRLTEPGGTQRQARFLSGALPLVDAYLGK